MSTSTKAAPYPLAGIRVADFSHVLAGPFCTRILCDLGAEVIKIETPEGDISRRLGRRRGGMSGYYMQQNCGKLNVSLDLKRAEGRALAARLAGACDVLVENFRPGVMDALGLGEGPLREANQGLIYCSISGFGHSSPLRSQRAFAGVVHAATGLLHRQAEAWGHEPEDSVLAVGDTVTGLQAAIAILAALQLRERTGCGQFIDMAMHDALLAIQEAANFTLFDEGGSDTDFLCAWVHRCKDEYVVIPADPRAYWSELTRVMGRPELRTDPRFDTYEKRAPRLRELEGIVGEWVQSFACAADAVAALHKAGVAAAKVLTLSQALASEQTRARAMTVQCDDRSGGTSAVLNSPYRFSSASAGVHGRAPFRGEDNRAVLTKLLGVDEHELRGLEESGVLSSRIPAAG
ncbi:MAG: CoA transferase [Deltaproteobacteria bacterium]|nr:CoA transferase [Deltaproteobacteria bacterium]